MVVILIAAHNRTRVDQFTTETNTCMRERHGFLIYTNKLTMSLLAMPCCLGKQNLQPLSPVKDSVLLFCPDEPTNEMDGASSIERAT